MRLVNELLDDPKVLANRPCGAGPPDLHQQFYSNLAIEQKYPAGIETCNKYSSQEVLL